MAVLVTYTFSLDRGNSIKLRSGLRVGIVSIFGEDPEQRHYLSPVTQISRFGQRLSRRFDFFIVCHMDSGRRVVRTQIYRIVALFT
jgi:hypothetical protein